MPAKPSQRPKRRVSSSTLVVTTAIQARPEQVFAALTEPELLKLWLALAWTDCAITAASIDLGAAAGRFRIESQEKSGKLHYLSGRLLQVDPPRLLSFTWDADWVTGEASVVTCRISAVRDGSELRIEHQGLGGEQAFARHAAGWRQIGHLLALGLPRVPAACLQRRVEVRGHA